MRTNAFGAGLSRAVVTLAAFAASGCSFLFTTAAPSGHRELPPSAPLECTSSVAAPVLDTVAAGFQTVRTVAAISVDDSVYEDQVLTRETDVGLGLVFTALFTASAIYGFGTTSTCREAKELRAERLRRTTEEPEFRIERRAPRRKPVAPAPAPPRPDVAPAPAPSLAPTAPPPEPAPAEPAPSPPGTPSTPTESFPLPAEPGQTPRAEPE